MHTEYNRTVEIGRMSGGHPDQPPCSIRTTLSRLPRTISPRWFLKISKKEDSTTFLGNLYQSSATLTVKCFSLCFWWHLLCFSLCPLPPVLSLDTTAKNLSLSSSLPLLWYPYTLRRPALRLRELRLFSLETFLILVPLPSQWPFVGLPPSSSFTSLLYRKAQ